MSKTVTGLLFSDVGFLSGLSSMTSPASPPSTITKLSVYSGFFSESLYDTNPDIDGDAYTGICELSSWDLFKERIIIKPAFVSVGQVVDVKTFFGWVWNASETVTATIQAIQITGNTGVTMTGAAVNQIIKPIQDAALVYKFGVVGPMQIDAVYVFVTDKGTVTQVFTGSRGTVIVTPPQIKGYSESQRWDTEIFVTEGGREYRSLRMNSTIPARSVIVPIKAISLEELATIDNILTFGTRYNLSVPLWFSLSELTDDVEETTTLNCDTTNRDFDKVSSVVVINKVTGVFSVREIISFTDSTITVDSIVTGFKAGDWVLPIISVTPSKSVSLTTDTQRQAITTIEFEELV